MWWDAADSRLRFVIISDERDAADFERAFRIMYPNAAFGEMRKTVPAWFDRGCAEYRVFDVGALHGHYATVFRAGCAQPHHQYGGRHPVGRPHVDTVRVCAV